MSELDQTETGPNENHQLNENHHSPGHSNEKRDCPVHSNENRHSAAQSNEKRDCPVHSNENRQPPAQSNEKGPCPVHSTEIRHQLAQSSKHRPCPVHSNENQYAPHWSKKHAWTSMDLAKYFENSEQSLKDGVTSLPSPQEVTSILCKNEFNKEFESGCVKSYDSNQLASNDPIEDTRSEGICRKTKGMLLSVFDGHGGPACAQVLSKRLLNYVAASLLPTETLTDYINNGANESLLETYNDGAEIVDDLKLIYEKKFKQYLQELEQLQQRETDVKTALEQAILKLDSDLSSEVVEAFDNKSDVHSKTLSVALSGAVACVCHIDGPHLHVANVGDCNAVLGTLTEDNEWIAKKITKEHNAENFDELKRIWNEHPEEERKTVIRRDRLLGELAPLRSLGDYRYKWTTEMLTKLAVPYVGPRAIPANYHTPPYLSAAPEIFYHRLTPKEKFLIIASDGLWDMMTPLQAVKLVGEHMKGKVFFNPLKLPRKNIQLGDLDELLTHRKESLKSKPKDRNAATHLIRHAIGGTEYGVDHTRLAHLLSLSSDVSRMFRDDITVTIAYFDSEFIRQCPA